MEEAIEALGFDYGSILNNIKIKLSITDDLENELLSLLLNDAITYMMIYFDGNIPTTLQFIMENVAVKKYRRIGAEGISIEKIDVLTTTYETGDDFAEYLGIMKMHKNRTNLGFRFL